MPEIATPPHSPRRRAEPDDPLAALPPGFAAIMRPEIPSLVQESITEIRRAIPKYNAYFEGRFARAVQLATEQTLASFVSKVDSPGTSTSQRDRLLRRIGRFEAYEGGNLDDLHAAFRIGARMALRRAKKVGRRYNLSPAVLLAFADAIFTYVEELIDISRAGFQEATAEMNGGQEAHRTKLLRELLAGTADHPRTDLKALADLAGWPLPDEVTLVALSPTATPGRGLLAGDVLVDLDDPQPHVLVPGPIDAERRALMQAAPHTIRAVMGLTVRLEDAATSLRWARQILGLVESGVIEDRPVTYCEDHLTALWLLRDPALLDHLTTRHLAPLAHLTATQRTRLVETLEAWLATRGNAVQMAELLHLHPQTVRYRMRLLDAAFGDQLADADRRFSTEIALRGLAVNDPPFPEKGNGPRPHPET
ncbi:helix-turn-helix domain-containing protein [Streptomyces monticola]|uniref:Helix-turn-helix domain-containing protein n=1 Tax=Streptomyces monticola TaxID=2666263 RepID=A0ABW2JBF3_9ACTN